MRNILGMTAAVCAVTGVSLAAALPGYSEQNRSGAAGLPTAATVIKAVLAAPSLVDYEGTKVVTAVRGTRVETVTVLESHKRPGTLRLEFLSPESVSGRLIVDDGTRTWQYEPSLHIVIQGPSLGGATSDVSRLREGMPYKAEVVGSEEVIGHETLVLALTTAVEGLSRRFWVDRATGVILRTEERSPREGVVFSAFFTRISYSLNLPAALFNFRLPAGARSFSFYLVGDPIPDPPGLRHRAGFFILAPMTLPMGYRFHHGAVARFGALTAATATYSDGVSLLTIFQTPTSRMAFPQAGEWISLGRGRGRFLDLGYMRILMWESHGLRLAAVGTLPVPALTAIAAAVDSARP